MFGCVLLSQLVLFVHVCVLSEEEESIYISQLNLNIIISRIKSPTHSQTAASD